MPMQQHCTLVIDYQQDLPVQILNYGLQVSYIDINILFQKQMCSFLKGSGE